MNDAPNADDVKKLREEWQLRNETGITVAQDHCASMLYTSRRTWQQWERSERKMHPAFWELAQIKIREDD